MKSMQSSVSKKGFTLIELLIVIAIIAVLAIAFVPSLLGAPSKARDTQRTSDVNKIAAFLIQKQLVGSTFPADGCIDSTKTDPSIGFFINENVAEFGGVYPLDPKGDNVPTGAKEACNGQYGYFRYDDTVKGYDSVVYAAVENHENGNIACDGLLNDLTPVLSPGKVAADKLACFAVLIQ